jgi:hypothetical protein
MRARSKRACRFWGAWARYLSSRSRRLQFAQPEEQACLFPEELGSSLRPGAAARRRRPRPILPGPDRADVDHRWRPGRVGGGQRLFVNSVEDHRSFWRYSHTLKPPRPDGPEHRIRPGPVAAGPRRLGAPESSIPDNNAARSHFFDKMHLAQKKQKFRSAGQRVADADGI